jgi:hypothetical protein
MGVYDDAKSNPLMIALVAISCFGSGWGMTELLMKRSGQERVTAGSYILLKDLQVQYVLRSEVQRSILEREVLAKQVESLKDKLDKIELELSMPIRPVPTEAFPTAETAADSTQTTHLPVDLVKTSGPAASEAYIQVNHDESLSGPNRPSGPGRKGLVFDPPSIVRTTPNGKISCWVNDPIEVSISGQINGSGGLWYYTDYCDGKRGVIHHTQVKLR